MIGVSIICNTSRCGDISINSGQAIEDGVRFTSILFLVTTSDDRIISVTIVPIYYRLSIHCL